MILKWFFAMLLVFITSWSSAENSSYLILGTFGEIDCLKRRGENALHWNRAIFNQPLKDVVFVNDAITSPALYMASERHCKKTYPFDQETTVTILLNSKINAWYGDAVVYDFLHKGPAFSEGIDDNININSNSQPIMTYPTGKRYVLGTHLPNGEKIIPDTKDLIFNKTNMSERAITCFTIAGKSSFRHENVICAIVCRVKS